MCVCVCVCVCVYIYIYIYIYVYILLKVVIIEPQTLRSGLLILFHAVINSKLQLQIFPYVSISFHVTHLTYYRFFIVGSKFFANCDQSCSFACRYGHLMALDHWDNENGEDLF